VSDSDYPSAAGLSPFHLGLEVGISAEEVRNLHLEIPVVEGI
jgi:hypothetical protein